MQVSYGPSPASRYQRAAPRPPSLPAVRGASPWGRRDATFSFAPCHDSLPPAQLLAALKRVLRAARDTIRADFDSVGDGIGVARQHSALMDALIRRLLLLTVGREAPAIAVAAVGGYGRAELAPGSDLDLLFLTTGQPEAAAVESIEFVLYRLWDLGLRVGHAVRSIDDCIDVARSDSRTAFSLLDLRFLCGQRALYDAAAGRIATEANANAEDLVDVLLGELASRHARCHDRRTPDVKHGPGGLRDLQTLRWLARLRGRLCRPHRAQHLCMLEPVGFDRRGAAQFLWSVRGHLHYLTGRAEERLSQDLQPLVARRLLCDERPERRSAACLMQRFHEATGAIAHCSARLRPVTAAACMTETTETKMAPIPTSG